MKVDVRMVPPVPTQQIKEVMLTLSEQEALVLAGISGCAVCDGSKGFQLGLRYATNPIVVNPSYAEVVMRVLSDALRQAGIRY